MRRSIVLAAATLVLAACAKKQQNPFAAVQTATAGRQNIVVDVEATGVIQPINTVQVRSKASGQIINMPVSLGSKVKPGELLVQVDPRQVQNVYNQSVAALAAAEANLKVTKAQLDRNESLAKAGVITAPELETAQLNYANAQAQRASAKTNLENAQIALEDATIRAPMAGVIIEKDVSDGQVISSATNTVGGGTLLLQMANLGEVMDSALVSESDIGNVRPGQKASVTVDAYPNRTFEGVVEKIAPQATVQQSVTMFPVLIRLQNSDGALMPGMNSDVSVLVQRRDDVLAVPNDAIRSPREGMEAASALGLDPSRVRQEIEQQLPGAGMEPNVNPTDTSSGTKMLGANDQRPRPGGFRRPGGFQPGARGPGGFAGRRPAGAMAAGAASEGEPPPLPGGDPVAFGVSRPRPGLVFLAQNGTFVPRVVVLGIGNYDVTEVLKGLDAGDQVALVTTAMLMQARERRLQRIQNFTSLPGMRQNETKKKPDTSKKSDSGGGRRN